MTKRLIIALYCTYSALNAAPTTPGTLDTTFNPAGTPAGTQTTPIGTTAEGRAITLQPDGKIVVAGYTGAAGAREFALTRYNTDGSLDNTFDGDGKVTTPIGTDAEGYAVAIQPDGKIVVGGFARIGNNRFALARYNTNGSLDDTFDNDGITTVNFLSDAQGYALAIQPNGKIIVAGFTFNAQAENTFALTRLNNDGSLDTTFNPTGTGGAQAGTVITPIGTGAVGYAVAIQSNGKIIVAGYANVGGNKFALARYNTDGSLDTATFNPTGAGGAQAGTVTTTIGTNAQGYSVALQPDGKIIVAGRTGAAGARQFALARYNTNGSLDTATFNPTGAGGAQAGTVITPIGTNAVGQSVALQEDGKIIVAGYTGLVGAQFALARYNTNGSLDTATFNPTGAGGAQAGTVTTTIGTNATGQSVALQSDGKIIVAGIGDNGATNVFALARYNNLGALTGLYGTQQETRYLAQGDLVNRLDWPAVTYATYYRIVANGQSFNSTLPNFEVHNVRPGNRIAYTISPFNASDEEGMPATITLGS